MNQQDKDRLRELAQKADTENTNVAWAHLDLYVTPKRILCLLEENEALSKKAARYDWLRYADNDEKVLRHYLSEPDVPGGMTMYLPRQEHLDDAIDTAMQHKGD